jgi:hypothetical protein
VDGDGDGEEIGCATVIAIRDVQRKQRCGGGITSSSMKLCRYQSCVLFGRKEGERVEEARFELRLRKQLPA